jgi:hypothetical protein
MLCGPQGDELHGVNNYKTSESGETLTTQAAGLLSRDKSRRLEYASKIGNNSLFEP